MQQFRSYCNNFRACVYQSSLGKRPINYHSGACGWLVCRMAASNKIFPRADPSDDWLTVRVGKRAAARAPANKRLRPLGEQDQLALSASTRRASRQRQPVEMTASQQQAAGASSKNIRMPKLRRNTLGQLASSMDRAAFDACAGLSYLGRHANCFPTPINHMKLRLRENRITCVRCHECKTGTTTAQCCPYLLVRTPTVHRSKLSPNIGRGPVSDARPPAHRPAGPPAHRPTGPPAHRPTGREPVSDARPPAHRWGPGIQHLRVGKRSEAVRESFPINYLKTSFIVLQSEPF